eukprot:TRINITY_DN11969_c0_g1_i1.p1 TRINITY_DN11969_c0_g1~~TRINITY_DN11969_c0_g1_i1.p1  ORF type:complete len:608 (+),score=98.00 TRINITY_DN11969_c0_g1_i1:830-2653(+)
MGKDEEDCRERAQRMKSLQTEEVTGSFPFEVLEHVLAFVTSSKDRNSVSLVCKAWYRVEAWTRSHVFVGNCYAVSPEIMIRRFRRVKSLTLKGKPRFADFNLVPPRWGAFLYPWVHSMSSAYPGLQRLSLKRMTVTDQDLSLVVESFPYFKELLLVCCDGLSTSALALIASNCRFLTELALNETEVHDSGADWLASFPDTTTQLESLSFDCLEGPTNFDALEKLVARCPSLKKLRVNKSVSLAQLHQLLLKAPQLTHLGTDLFSERLALEQGDDEFAEMIQEQLASLHSVFGTFKNLQSYSGFREGNPEYLPVIYPACCNLISLNFSYANIGSSDLEEVIRHCHKLKRLWVLDTIEDNGLHAVAETCRDLRDLRVFPVDAREDGQGSVSDEGLIAISEGCRNLESVLYFCQRMTNAAVVTLSNNCPNLEVFRLCIMDRGRPDHLTGAPMDEAFGAIVRNCKKLTRLALSGLITDKAFEYIGRHGKLLKTLSVAFAGDTDLAMIHVLNGCTNLKKLEIRDCPFGSHALVSGLHRYESMRFLWMSSCKVTLEGCMKVAEKLPSVVIEILGDDEWGNESLVNSSSHVEKLYLYRSVAGPRKDKPPVVKIL